MTATKEFTSTDSQGRARILDKSDAKQLAALHDAELAAIEALSEERARIVYESTIDKLNRNTEAAKAAHARLLEIKRQQRKFVAAPTPRELELKEQIKQSLRTENGLLATAGLSYLPDRYIASDGVAKCEGELRRLKAEHDEICERFKESEYRSMGPRTKEMLREIDDAIRAVEKERPHAQLGEQVWKVRQEREAMQAECDRLKQQREREVFAA